MDSLLMNLNSNNNRLLLNCEKNMDTAVQLLEAKKIAETGEKFTENEIEDIKNQIKSGKPFETTAFYRTCPPYEDGKPPAEWWSNTAAYTVLNLCPAINVDVSVIDPTNEVIEIQSEDVLFNLGKALDKNKKDGVYTIVYKITDLKEHKTSRFVHKFSGKASTN